MIVPRERWRPVVGYEGKYEVSSLGRVRRIGGRKRDKKPTLYYLAGTLSVYGYVHVRLYADGVGRDFRRAPMVMAAFKGPCPAGMEVLHGNNNRADDRLSNLRYGTRADNEKDKIAAGTSNRGSRHGMAKLTDQDVKEIRRRVQLGELHKDVAKDYGVVRQTIGAIWNDVLWGHHENS